ncbi:hypothetical protein BDZ97DRAFT_1916003 [Flammula alnicola]|nr:hypothetical protein BDZ97DRAFT_1916003 [Flammula alnicola]
MSHVGSSSQSKRPGRTPTTLIGPDNDHEDDEGRTELEAAVSPISDIPLHEPLPFPASATTNQRITSLHAGNRATLYQAFQILSWGLKGQSQNQPSTAAKAARPGLPQPSADPLHKSLVTDAHFSPVPRLQNAQPQHPQPHDEPFQDLLQLFVARYQAHTTKQKELASEDEDRTIQKAEDAAQIMEFVQSSAPSSTLEDLLLVVCET